ncbi:uncharacterized protein SPPG_02167 [Spizellomyces punctatus DAOM BR117]|uniref:ATP synthase mitochondrial F1 complex assembly factor 1 n=1 Tax=Spizellomyces punctatus (strain DAOM BR117) TaxID=645134 RepID=A0A0L0HPZ9_SPIPD|nr:uncharacterized protein SPPG_02167 [Spizellomyces punctatus DAOM BR117]KND03103.1 hypothetical protein SPPG_02167 [Spizellomyces punctatus DAOM BR117]|eukprot:XP_016611142.1 hypothetical protein SPPG_02167 [Spizellomyces punctatus DAOM BR117]
MSISRHSLRLTTHAGGSSFGLWRPLARPFATLAPEFHHLLHNAPATKAPPTALRSIWDGLLSAVLSPDDVANEYRKKYADKLKKAVQSEGAKSVDELIQRKRSAPPPEPSNENKDDKPDETKTGKSVKGLAPRADGLPSHVKSLEKIVDVERLKQESSDQIANIWNEYHSSRQCLSGAMPSSFYQSLLDQAKKFPMFLLPLPRNEGYEFFLLQFSGHQIYFTPLLEYKTHRENARPHLVLTHYVELADEKDIVLMVGELGDPDRKILTLQEAQNLVYQMQIFYVTGSQAKKDLVETFHKNPAGFDYQSLISAVETLS